MRTLTRESIAPYLEAPPRRVELPDDFVAYLRPVTASELLAWGDAGDDEASLYLLAKSLVTEDGTPVFIDAGAQALEELGSWPGKITNPLLAAALELNGLESSLGDTVGN